MKFRASYGSPNNSYHGKMKMGVIFLLVSKILMFPKQFPSLIHITQLHISWLLISYLSEISLKTSQAKAKPSRIQRNILLYLVCPGLFYIYLLTTSRQFSWKSYKEKLKNQNLHAEGMIILWIWKPYIQLIYMIDDDGRQKSNLKFRLMYNFEL